MSGTARALTLATTTSRPPKASADLSDPRREGVAVAHVDDRSRDVAAAAQVVVRRHHFAGVSRAEADDGPFVEEGADDGAPDATRPSRHQNSFAGELKIHGAGLSLSG